MMEIEFLDFWHCGQNPGDRPESPVVRDEADLPLIPSTSLQGALCQAVAEAEEFGHVPEGTRARLFEVSTGSALRVGDARITTALREWLAMPEQETCRRALSREWTLIASGKDRARTRRRIEVIIPMELEAQISLSEDAQPPENWHELLTKALPLIGAIGGLRSRGLGRCRMNLRIPA